MTIYTNSLVVQGALNGATLHANTLSGASNASSITIMNDIAVHGNVFTNGRMDVSDTMYMTMRAGSNIAIGSGEHFIRGNDMLVDLQSSDPTSISKLTNVSAIWDWTAGKFIVPFDGLYTIELQGSFSNNPAFQNPTNGVYWYFRNQAFPNARVAATMSGRQVAHTSTTRYMLTGDVVQPTFYSNDPDAVLVGGTGESYLAFLITNTVTAAHQNYFRVPVV